MTKLKELYRVNPIGKYIRQRYDANITDSVAVVTTLNKDYVLSDEYISVIKDIYITIQPPTGATTGAHNVRIFPAIQSIYSGIILEGAYNKYLSLKYGDIFEGDAKRPADTVAFQNQIRNMEIAPGDSLRFAYYNGTNAVQNNTMQFYIIYELHPAII